MAFSTLVFPFVFLPVSLILYFVLPKQLKNAALVVCSLVFFAWGRRNISFSWCWTSRSTISRAVSWRFRKRAAGAGGSCSSRPWP